MTERLTPATPHETDTKPDKSEDWTFGHEAFMDAQPLYPSVQHAMDNLKRLIEEGDGADEVPRTAAGEPIATPEVFEAWAKEEGFGNGRRGTFHNNDTYVYIKHCNLVPAKEDVDKTLAVARHLTSLGAIHPESQWSVFESSQEYQLFVVSPRLEPWLLEEKLEGAYEGRSSQPEGDLSHVEDWFKRIDPNFVPKQPIPQGSLLHHLNWTEASNADNWGWDKTGALFPVDVEVLRPQEPGLFKDPEPWGPIHHSPIDYTLDL